MADQNEWETKAANLLKAELKKKGITYAQLVEKLEGIGICEKEVNVRNKLSRGKFTAAFLLQCLSAVGSQQRDICGISLQQLLVSEIPSGEPAVVEIDAFVEQGVGAPVDEDLARGQV